MPPHHLTLDLLTSDSNTSELSSTDSFTTNSDSTTAIDLTSSPDQPNEFSSDHCTTTPLAINEPDPNPLSSLPPLPTKKQHGRHAKKGRIYLQSIQTLYTNKHQLLTFTANVDGQPAKVLIDGGAEGNIIRSSFCHSNKNIAIHDSPAIPVVLPNGTASFAHYTATITLKRDQYLDHIDSILYPLRKYDLILGKPWLTQVNPMINWRTNEVEFTTSNNNNIHWTCRGFTRTDKHTPSILISALNFAILAHDSPDNVFLAYVKLTQPPPSNPPVPPDIPEAVRHIVKVEFPDVFPSELPDHLPPDRGGSMRIDIDPNADPPVRPVIRLSIAELDELRRQLNDLLKKKYISTSTSPFGAPVLFVKKKDGSLRMCVDYRGLNKITRKNRHPLPRIDELIDRLRTAKCFSKLDLISGYYQMPIHPDDRHKTAFRTRYGHFEWNVVPFGLTNAPAAFSAMMTNALAPAIDKCVVLYLDDILIYSDNEKQHLRDLRAVLTLLRQAGLYAKLSKCTFLQPETEFLGHILTKDGIKMNGGLVKAIQEWPTPRKQREVMQFLGLTQYYHQHIAHYSHLALPLTELLAKDTRFHWDPPQQQAFDALKNAVTTAPVLRIFDPALLSAVETDASGFAVGAVLFQTDAFGHSRPVAFTSRKMNNAERNYPTHEQELLAIVHALKTWRYYLDGSHFIVYTDHATLTHFPTQPNLTRRQARWMELFQEYDFDFRYKPGKDNIVPDALSRRPDYNWDPSTLHNITIAVDPTLKQHFRDLYIKDPQLGPLLSRYSTSAPNSRYFVDDGLLWTNIAGSTRLCVPQDNDLRTQILHDHHDAPISGHLGFDKTYEEMRRTYFWPRMARDTKAYITTCEECQRNKPSLQLKAGLFTPLETPLQRWNTVTMDFIVQLPKTTQGFDAITVFVDKLSKQVHFCASHTTDSAIDVARLFFAQVFRLHGMPRTFISDRDSKFTGKFWRALCKMMGIKQNMSTAYHPQSDGQTERANRTLEEMLRPYISYHQRDWDKYLPMMEFSYNNSVNPSTGYSPFFLNQGYHPIVPSNLIKTTNTPIPAVSDFVQQQSSALALAQDAIAHAQLRQQQNEDRNRRPTPFAVGDKVLLSTEHISAAALANRPSKKLEPNFIGPFTIIEAINDNAFKLELPPSMQMIHPVFNADLLKAYHPSPSAFPGRTPPRPPPILVEGTEEYEVESILDYRIKGRRPEWLIKWKGYPLDEASWEPKDSLANATDILSSFESKRTNELK